MPIGASALESDNVESDSHEEIDESSANTALDDGLDLVVGAVRQVADSPTGIDENLVIQRVDELGEDSESGGDLFEFST